MNWGVFWGTFAGVLTGHLLWTWLIVSDEATPDDDDPEATCAP